MDEDDYEDGFVDAICKYAHIAGREYLTVRWAQIRRGLETNQALADQMWLDIMFGFGRQCYNKGFLDGFGLANRPEDLKDYFENEDEDVE